MYIYIYIIHTHTCHSVACSVFSLILYLGEYYILIHIEPPCSCNRLGVVSIAWRLRTDFGATLPESKFCVTHLT